MMQSSNLRLQRTAITTCQSILFLLATSSLAEATTSGQAWPLEATVKSVAATKFYPPTRMVMMDVSVNQTTRAPSPHAGAEITNKTSCSSSGLMPLFDLAKVPTADQESDKFVSCKVEFGKFKAELRVAGAVILKHGVEANRGDGKLDFKVFSYSTKLIFEDGRVVEAPFAFAMVDNLEAKTMVLRAYAGDLDTKNLSASVNDSPMKDDKLEINIVFKDR